VDGRKGGGAVKRESPVVGYPDASSRQVAIVAGHPVGFYLLLRRRRRRRVARGGGGGGGAAAVGSGAGPPPSASP
jgi:hypothetical protein